MPYTTQGLMTAQDMAEVIRDMDLDLCPCCESGHGIARDPHDPDGPCEMCGHDLDAH